MTLFNISTIASYNNGNTLLFKNATAGAKKSIFIFSQKNLKDRERFITNYSHCIAGIFVIIYKAPGYRNWSELNQYAD